MDEHRDIDSILRRIEAEVGARKGAGPQFPGSEPLPTVTQDVSGGSPPVYIPQQGDEPMTLDQLLTFRDEEFIQAAYRNVLRREPDPDGAAHYLSLIHI